MKPDFHQLSNIIISRTDSIGDVILTLPVATVLKQQYPGITIAFLGRAYTRPVIQACASVDVFIEKEDFLKGNVLINGKVPEAILHVFPVREIAEKAKALEIPLRIGTTNRLYHWFNCNKLIPLSRKSSNLHEAQLNLRLLRALNIYRDYSMEEIGHLYNLQRLPVLAPSLEQYIDPQKLNIILHPRSQGSAREWGTDYFLELIKLAGTEKFRFFITGTEKEKQTLMKFLEQASSDATDLTGKMSLDQMIAFISRVDGLVACSTGPLHLAAALGKYAWGIYPPVRPMHPGRWAPLGTHAHFFVAEKECGFCRKNPAACTCMKAIKPMDVANTLRRAWDDTLPLRPPSVS